MVAKQQRSLKTAGFTFFIFALAYTVVDAIVFVIADYKDGLPSVTGGNIVLEFVVMSFFSGTVRVVFGYHLLLFIYLYFAKFSLARLRGWQVLWMSFFSGILVPLLLIIAALIFVLIKYGLMGESFVAVSASKSGNVGTNFLRWFYAYGNTSVAISLFTISSALTPIVLWLVLRYMRLLRAKRVKM